MNQFKKPETKSCPNILFVSTFQAQFIESDFEILKEKFKVTKLSGNGLIHVLRLMLACFKHDIAFCWFASTYSSIVTLIMRTLHKKSIIVIGGVDIAKDEKLKYGIWINPWKALLVKQAIKLASVVIVQSEEINKRVKMLANYDGKNIIILPTAYDTNFWQISDKPKLNYILTVALCNDKKRLLIKGIDILLRTAEILSDFSFIIIGINDKVIKGWNIPSNVQVISAMERKSLLKYYQEAKIYCQPSRHEGMSNSLCEAMLCGCIPVATDVGATRSVLNNTGFLVKPEDPAELARALKLAMELKADMSSIRKQVEKYTIVYRKEKLTEIIFSL